jgi:DnaJ domain
MRMNHQFSLDPRSVLGVSSDASMEEIDKAYRAKSKKHHPDVGGDEWAFRIVARSFEILKSTAGSIAEKPAYATAVVPDPSSWSGRNSTEAGGPWTTSSAWSGGGTYADATSFNGAGTTTDEGAELPSQSQEASPSPVEFQTVEAELIWIRFAFAGTPAAPLDQEESQTTLSVCMVISWPKAPFVSRAFQFADTPGTLHHVIDSFELLRNQAPTLASRSRIEDGQFVGWLSYPDVVQAMMGFESLKNTLSAHHLQIELRTRDEQIPQDWQGR